MRFTRNSRRIPVSISGAIPVSLSNSNVSHKTLYNRLGQNRAEPDRVIPGPCLIMGNEPNPVGDAYSNLY